MKSHVSTFNIYIVCQSLDWCSCSHYPGVLKFVISYHYGLLRRGIISDEETDLCGTSRIIGWNVMKEGIQISINGIEGEWGLTRNTSLWYVTTEGFQTNKKLELSDAASVCKNLAGIPSTNTGIKHLIQHFHNFLGYTMPRMWDRWNHQSHWIWIWTTMMPDVG